MHRLMVMFLSLIVLAFPVNALSVAVTSSSSPASNQSEITSSHGGFSANKSPLGQCNVIAVKTDHAAIAERLARKSKHTSAFWDDFYNTATVSMGVYSTPRNSPQYKKLYTVFARPTNDDAFINHWRRYHHEGGDGPLAPRMQTQGYAEWRYVMNHIDLDNLLREAK